MPDQVRLQYEEGDPEEQKAVIAEACNLIAAGFARSNEHSVEQLQRLLSDGDGTRVASVFYAVISIAGGLVRRCADAEGIEPIEFLNLAESSYVKKLDERAGGDDAG